MYKNFVEALENYTIIDNPDLIAVESYIYGALESDLSEAKELKSNLNKLARAKSKNDSSEVNELKKDIDENVKALNEAAKEEKDTERKRKLIKIAKIGAGVAGAIVTAVSIAAVAKGVKKGIAKHHDKKQAKAEVRKTLDRTTDELFKAIKSDDGDAIKRAVETRDKTLHNIADRHESFKKTIAKYEAEGLVRDRNFYKTHEKIDKQLAELDKGLDDLLND